MIFKDHKRHPQEGLAKISLLAAALTLLVAIAPTKSFAVDDVDFLEKLSGGDVHGFANMGFRDDTSTDYHRRFSRGFYLNNFDLYYSPDMGNRTRFLAEVVFEPDAENQAPTFDAERLQAGYVVSNNLTIWAGRFHTPLGYYTIAYHHGMELQTAIEKPRFIDFEDHYGVLPVHSNGLLLNYTNNIGDHRYSLMAWTANSDRLTVDGNDFTMLDFDMVHNNAFKLAAGARVNWIFGGALDGWTIGATYLHEGVDWDGGGGGENYKTGTPQGTGAPDVTPNPNVQNSAYNAAGASGLFSSDLNMTVLHVVYDKDGIEFLNELYMFNNGAQFFNNTTPGAWDKNSSTYASTAGFSQLAYWFQGKYAPFVRYERGDFNTQDPYFMSQYNGLPYMKIAGGYHHILNDNSALKIEYSGTQFFAKSFTNIGQNYSDIQIDYSIRF